GATPERTSRHRYESARGAKRRPVARQDPVLARRIARLSGGYSGLARNVLERLHQGALPMSEESKKAMNEAVEELEAAREAARLKLHLFSMDARRALEGLEEKAKD